MKQQETVYDLNLLSQCSFQQTNDILNLTHRCAMASYACAQHERGRRASTQPRRRPLVATIDATIVASSSSASLVTGRLHARDRCFKEPCRRDKTRRANNAAIDDENESETRDRHHRCRRRRLVVCGGCSDACVRVEGASVLTIER